MPCIVPACPREAHHNFGVRCRRPATTAIWAPNTEAFLCDYHATCGMRITVVLDPRNDGQIETHVISGDGIPVTRITNIVKAAEE